MVVVGEYTASMSIGSIPLSGRGRQGFVAAFDPDDGSERWAVDIGSDGDDRARRLAISGAGDLYVAGRFESEFTRDSVTVPHVGLQDGVLLQYAATSSAATLVRAVTVASAATDELSDVTVTAAGPCVAGFFSDTVSIGGTVLTTAGDLDALYACFDTTLAPRFARSFGSASFDLAPNPAPEEASSLD